MFYAQGNTGSGWTPIRPRGPILLCWCGCMVVEWCGGLLLGWMSVLITESHLTSTTLATSGLIEEWRLVSILIGTFLKIVGSG